MRTLRTLPLLVAALLALTAGCKKRAEERELRVFHASGLTPVLDAVRDDARERLGLSLLTEASGSQVACRKVTELGRPCDLVMLADGALVAELLAGVCSWRLDFATDEMVLGVGMRAPHADEAEEDWTAVLARPDVRLARVDENQGPVGYCTLLVWKLQEQRGAAGLSERLRARCKVVVEHVSRLTPLLKSGEVDYAFVYRSICLAHDVRYVELDAAINLGSEDVDYSGASVTYRKLGAGDAPNVTMTGAPIVWSLSIPDAGADTASAMRFVRYMLRDRLEVLERNGMRPMKEPAFYGSRTAFAPFAGFSRYGGALR